MEAGREKLLRRITIGATAVTAAVLLTADYGSQPHALSAVSKWLAAGKNWVLKPSDKELAELEQWRQVHIAQKDSDDKDVDKT